MGIVSVAEVPQVGHVIVDSSVGDMHLILCEVAAQLSTRDKLEPYCSDPTIR